MERPILFSAPMVQAILDGRKTQTRRIIQHQCEHTLLDNYGLCRHCDHGTGYYRCRYGKQGNVLWVRETFYAYGHWSKTIHSKTEKNGWKEKVEWHFHDLTLSEGKNYFFENCPPAYELIMKGRYGLGYFKRPSIFMPKEACRIKLLVKDIRVERLKDITEKDAIAEGIEMVADYGTTGYKLYTHPDNAYSDIDAVWSYESLWESINGKGSWNNNPWVWVIEVERIK